MTRLSVNLNKIALIRNSRNADKPNVLTMAKRSIAAGAAGITVHPRPDQRHTRYSDVRELAAFIRPMPGIEFNVEGNPTPEFMKIVLETKPDQCTLVPDAPSQLTSDHGWDVIHQAKTVSPIIKRLQDSGIRVSLFLDPVPEQIEATGKTGTDRIELYTEHYAKTYGTVNQGQILQEYAVAAKLASSAGLGVNAGHDLSLENLGLFLSTIPLILEVSIGHALVVECFDYGLEGTVERYVKIVEKTEE